MIEIKDVSRVFGNEKALNNVSFSIKGGMNFIIGASGSGKSTLIKIISAMDRDFSGDVFYNNQSVKALTTKEKYDRYANTFGFISQNFNLIEHLTVLENIMLPQYLKDNSNENSILQILKSLSIEKLANQKVKNLSGGQKQRVAIARELLKNPDVLIADEPTAALDPKSAKVIIDILRKIAKTKTVIVVTHDTSLIDNNSSVFELDKGELVSVKENTTTQSNAKQKSQPPLLSLSSAFKAGFVNLKRYKGRFMALILGVVVASCCLLVNFTDIIGGSSKKAIDDLVDSYGNSILEMLITPLMLEADQIGSENAGTGNKVEQSIDGLYEKYINDERVDHIRYTPSIINVNVSLDGKKFTPKPSNSLPSFDELLSGRMPNGDGTEVIISDTVAQKLGYTNDSILGKEIDISAGMFVTVGNKTELKSCALKATVVGVMSTKGTLVHEGQSYDFDFEDAMFFSISAIRDIKSQVGLDMNVAPFTLRAKTPQGLISIKNEMMKNGIVPFGEFEKLEDIIKLDDMTTEQSGTSYVLIAILALVAAMAVTIITALLRKNEFAIYKINGYGSDKLSKVIACEYVLIAAISSVCIGITGLVLIITGKAISFATMGIALLMTFAISLLCMCITAVIGAGTKESKSLRTGDK